MKEFQPKQEQDQARREAGEERGERQPLPSVLDVLERRAQLFESPLRRRIAHEDSRLEANRAAYREFRERKSQLGDELATLYAEGTDRDRLILDVYTTLVKTSSSKPVNWSLGLQADETRRFIAKVAPMSERELSEELRKAQEALERKTAISIKMQRTRALYETLTPEERDESRRETQREYGRRRYRERKEQARLQVDRPQPSQVFPPKLDSPEPSGG